VPEEVQEATTATKASALAAAEQMLKRNAGGRAGTAAGRLPCSAHRMRPTHAPPLLCARAGKSVRDTYVRMTLVSYGASCKVFTAHHRGTNRKVAVKTLSKVCVRPPACCLLL